MPATPGAETVVVAVVTEPASRGRPTQIARATLPQPRMGRFRVQVAYAVPESASCSASAETCCRCRDRRALESPTIASRSLPRLILPSRWTSRPIPRGSQWMILAGESALVLSTSEAAGDLPLVIEPLVRDRPQATTVERAWLQTWQVGSTIQDRAVFKFRTTGSAVTVELPPLMAVQEVEVLADGELAQVSTRQEGRLIVELAKSSTANALGSASHTLELRYRRPAPVGLVARHEFTPPQLVGTSALSEVYWQVVLPGDRHVVRTPGQLVPVDAWQWLEVFWGRPTTKTQAEMEEWAGASSQLGPSSAQNAYLFSGLAPVASIEMLTAPRG